MSDEVLVERRGAVQVITINRPAVKNALDAGVAAGVAAAVDELDETDDLRVGVLTGAGGTFSAGMDLKAWLRGESPAIEGRGLCGITVTPPRKPLIAAVEGWALAGGFELMLACDLVVASRSARLPAGRTGSRSTLRSRRNRCRSRATARGRNTIRERTAPLESRPPDKSP